MTASLPFQHDEPRAMSRVKDLWSSGHSGFESEKPNVLRWGCQVMGAYGSRFHILRCSSRTFEAGELYGQSEARSCGLPARFPKAPSTLIMGTGFYMPYIYVAQ